MRKTRLAPRSFLLLGLAVIPISCATHPRFIERRLAIAHAANRLGSARRAQPG
jgi:hypothetical protein